MATSVERRRKRSASAERIKNAYNGANNVEVEVIEAVGTAKTDDTPKEMRVCAYCRVSTEEESQQSSYELQVQHYTQYINDHENWTLQGIYADEGISGTSVMHRKQFLQMIGNRILGRVSSARGVASTLVFLCFFSIRLSTQRNILLLCKCTLFSPSAVSPDT